MMKKVSATLFTVMMITTFLLGLATNAYAKTALKITKQPVSVVVQNGKTAKTSFKVKGDGLKYKWYYKDDGSKKFKVTSDFKSNSYSVKMSKKVDGRQVYCTVTDKYGKSVKTNTVTLKTPTVLKIKQQPKSVAVLNGKTAQVSFKVKGDGLKYKWYYKNADSKKFTSASKFKSNSYSVKMDKKVNGRQVYCKITDKYGNSVKTKTVTLSLKTPLKITKQPSASAVLNGKTAKVSFKVIGDGLKYKWYYKNAGSKKFSSTSTFKSNSYSVKMSKKVSGRQVYCKITDKYGKSVKTKTVSLTLKTPLKITKQPVSVSALNGKTAKVSFKASGDGLTYKWYYKNAGTNKFTSTSSFKGNYYSVTMDKSRSGRQVYCKVTDKYGDSVKTKTVTVSMRTTLKITKQPASVAAYSGKTAEVSFKVSGDGLTYKWYFKNPGGKEFKSTSSFKSNSYSVIMDKSRNGRQVYCKVTDKYGKSVTTKTVTLSMMTLLEIVVQPQDVVSAAGTVAEVSLKANGDGLTYKWYYKSVGSNKFVSTSSFKSNSYSVTMNKERDGRQVYCVVTDKYGNSVTSEVVTLTMTSTYTITVDKGVGDDEIVEVSSDGKYSLKAPSVSGYKFKGWVDSDGKSFSSSGTVRSDVKVKAVWQVGGTDTLKELLNRTQAGVEEIKITGNITVTQPIFINYNTKIYADSNYSLKRAADYSGDIFVVGQDKNGVIGVIKHRKPELSLGSGKGVLTIDGNRSGVKVDVVGSALLVSDSSTLNIYDNVRIVNNKKSGNKRVFNYDYFISAEKLQRAGGAAIINLGATVNMYGGVIDNNLVSTEYTVITNEDGTQSSAQLNSCGGAIYNRGNFNMLGGTISNSEALRGGAVYSDRNVYFKAGKISGNTAHSYGGAFSSSSAANADTFIGSEDSGTMMIFENNYSKSYGGAVYSLTKSPVVIYGNTKFVGNTADSSGGAIYTAGTLTVRNTTFTGNSSVSNGGAIYHCYADASVERRLPSFTDCVFENNKSNVGGAVILTSISSASDAGKGTTCSFNNCTFTGNQAVMKDTTKGNGGAIYITKQSDAAINGCAFNKNTSTKGAGAIYLTKNSNATVKNSTFKENTADDNAGAISVYGESSLNLLKSTFNKNSALNGGALYGDSKTVLKLTDITFNGNTAVLNDKGGDGVGGAIYLTEADVTTKNIDMHNNSAGTKGGAIYMNCVKMNLDAESEFVGNTSAQHGGAFYLSYKANEDGSKSGSVLNANGSKFDANIAMAGGAISARSACEVNLTNVTLTNNTSDGFAGNNDGNGEGGGAVYVGYGKVTMKNVTADGNKATDFGGVVNAYGSEVTVSGGSYTGNISNRGGVLHSSNNSVISFNGSEIKGNESPDPNTAHNSSIGGGAIFANSGILTITESTLVSNKAGYYGGAVIANKATVTISDKTLVSACEGGTGAALYFKGASKVIIKDTDIKDNVASASGIVYQNGGTLDMTNVTASGNTARRGGVLYTSGATTVVTANGSKFNGNTVTNNGGAIYADAAAVKLDDVEFKNNAAGEKGGAIHSQIGSVEIRNVIFDCNVATASSGGAINLEGSALITAGINNFTGNSAGKSGGAINVDYFVNDDEAKTKTFSSVTMNGGSFTKNSAGNGGAVNAASGNTVKLYDVPFAENTSTGSGGALYIYDAVFAAKNLDFVKNSAGYHGGALYLNATNLDIDKEWSFTENSAVQHGGAVYLGYKTNADNTKTGAVLNAVGVSFNSNTAMAGGAVSVRSACEVKLTDVKLTNNTVNGFAGNNDGNGDGGGAIYVGYGKAALKNVTAEGNTATDFGGVVNAYSSTVSVVGGTFSSNSANRGGVLYAMGNSDVSFNKSILKANKSPDANASHDSSVGGGAVYSSGSTVTIIDCTLDSNKTGYYGGAILSDKSAVTISDGTKITASGGATGSALYSVGGSTVTISDVSLTGNTSTANGVVYQNSGTLDVTDAVAVGNTARKGGVFYISGGSLTATKVNAAANIATIGGVIYTGGAKTSVTVNSCSWNENTATNGGAIYTEKASVNLIGSTVKKNTSENGGAAYIIDGAVLNLSGAILDGNSATGKGGAIYMADNSTVSVSDNSTLKNNTAPSAGAVYVDKGAALTINNSSLEGNSASEGDGGAILTDDSSEEGAAFTTLNMTGVSLKNNTAVGKGGALSTVTGKPNLVINATECTFNGNKSLNAGGGAVEIQNGNCNSETDPVSVPIVFSRCSFIGNSAKSTGGAIEIRSGSCAKIDGIIATENVAEGNGAVIYATSDNSRVYLTGEVSQSENISLGGTFIHLYKKSTYENPPKIYTTHGSDAAWISNVGGNANNIEFGMATLP